MVAFTVANRLTGSEAATLEQTTILPLAFVLFRRYHAIYGFIAAPIQFRRKQSPRFRRAKEVPSETGGRTIERGCKPLTCRMSVGDRRELLVLLESRVLRRAPSSAARRGQGETQLFIKLYEKLRSRGEADKDSRARTVAAFKAANSAPK